MKTLLTIVLVLSFSPSLSAHKLKDFPDDLQVSLWENQFYKSTRETIFPLINELLHLPEKPFPPRLKKLVLDIHKKHFEGNKKRDLPATSDCREELSYLNRMALWQKGDVDFLPVLLENMGGKTTYAVADLGAPAFPHILKLLHKNGFPGAQIEGVRGLNRMYENDFQFLKESHNLQLSRAGLANVLNSHYEGWGFIHTEAVNALQHIPGPEVENLLFRVRQSDAFLQETRERATFILQLLRTTTQ